MQGRIGRLNGRFTVSWQDPATGKRRRYRLDACTAKAAEAEARDVILRESSRREAATIAALWAAYCADAEGRRIARNMVVTGRVVLPKFGHLRPDQLQPADSRAHIAARRAQGLSDSTIRTELNHLRIVLNWAVKRRLIERAPHVERPPEPPPRERWLTEAEIDRLLAAPTDPHIRLAMLLMLGTAGRIGAVLGLTWDRVDFDRGVIDLREDSTAPRKGRAVVPMNAGLRAALSAAKDAALSDWVVEYAGRPVASIKVGLAAVARRAGVEGVTPHVFRHTAAVHLAARGVPMQRIAQYLGHTSTATTERTYARFSPDHMRAESEILDFARLREVHRAKQ